MSLQGELVWRFVNIFFFIFLSFRSVFVFISRSLIDATLSGCFFFFFILPFLSLRNIFRTFSSILIRSHPPPLGRETRSGEEIWVFFGGGLLGMGWDDGLGGWKRHIYTMAFCLFTYLSCPIVRCGNRGFLGILAVSFFILLVTLTFDELVLFVCIYLCCLFICSSKLAAFLALGCFSPVGFSDCFEKFRAQRRDGE